MIKTVSKKRLKRTYVDAKEEREILGDAALMRRLCAGTRDAKLRRGRLIG
jgi:hypothetical protein